MKLKQYVYSGDMAAGDKTPEAIWSGTIRVLGFPLLCHVLDNGQRVVDVESFAQFCEASPASGHTSDEINSEMAKFAQWMKGVE